MSMSNLDSNQCIKTAFDDASGTLKVSQTGDVTIELAASDGDSVLATGSSDGTSSGTLKVLKVDSSGNLFTRSVAYSSAHIATNTTTTIKSGAGALHSITINTVGIGNTATIYDNTAGSGTVLAVIATAIAGPTTLYYDVAFATGLTVVTASGSPADITVSYL